MRPLRALPRLAERSLEAARQAGSLALSLARTVAEPVLGRRAEEHEGGSTRNREPPPARPAGEPPARPAGEPPAPPAAPPPETTRAAAPAAARPRPAAAPEPPPAPPAHVDRDAVVVAESADAGAAGGAGATLRVDEPWPGYDRLKARDVTAQLATADAATLGVVRLYESTHRKRRTVLEDVDRRLATAGR